MLYNRRYLVLKDCTGAVFAVVFPYKIPYQRMIRDCVAIGGGILTDEGQCAGQVDCVGVYSRYADQKYVDRLLKPRTRIL